MGNYQSRPTTLCADELKKKISEGYSKLRSKLSDDLKARPESWSALQLTCHQGSLASLEECAADEWCEVSEHGLTLGHIACTRARDRERTQPLLHHLLSAVVPAAQHAAFLNTPSNNGFTLLQLAVYKGDVSLVEYLVSSTEACAGAAWGGANRLPAVHIAAMCGHHELVELLVDRAHVALDAVDWVHFAPLHVAAYFGHEKVVASLLARKADPNVCGGVRDRPIHLASAKGFIGIVKLLLEFGADPLLADDEGNTCLHFCCRAGHASLVELFLKPPSEMVVANCGADAGVTPLRDSRTMELAQKCNAYEDTPLHVACYSGKLEVVRRLLQLSGSTQNLSKVRTDCTLQRGELWRRRWCNASARQSDDGAGAEVQRL